MGKEVPAFVNCVICKQRIEVKICRVSIDKDTLQELITRITEPSYPYFAVHCISCGHYMVFNPEEKKETKM